MGCTTVFPSDVVISMTLLDLAFIFTAGIWVVIKALNKLKMLFHLNKLFVPT